MLAVFFKIDSSFEFADLAVYNRRKRRHARGLIGFVACESRQIAAEGLQRNAGDIIGFKIALVMRQHVAALAALAFEQRAHQIAGGVEHVGMVARMRADLLGAHCQKERGGEADQEQQKAAGKCGDLPASVKGRRGRRSSRRGRRVRVHNGAALLSFIRSTVLAARGETLFLCAIDRLQSSGATPFISLETHGLWVNAV